MTFEELKLKALSLPYEPGVYIMKDKTDRVIYVGKARKLKNRVSQYFQDTASHSPKTRAMVSKIDHFDVIVAASEFEALVLECSLIKRHMPRYNILLKDDKGYPYIRLDVKSRYPVFSVVNKIQDDGASYYGPYGTRRVTYEVLDVLRKTLGLPDCDRRFPQDIGKDRPCLNLHMGQCEGWCRPGRGEALYRERIEQAQKLLTGGYRSVASQIKGQMLEASDSLEFELAATLRDRLKAVEALGQRQLVTAGALADLDVIGYAETESKACFAVLHFCGGDLVDKEHQVFSVPEDKEQAVSSLVMQYYLSRGIAPKLVLLPFEVEDGDLFSQLLERETGRKTKLKVPQRGDNVRLVELAGKNAYEEAQRITTKEEKASAGSVRLGKMLGIEAPQRIESFDISNISGTDIVGGMVVFQSGKPKKSDYRRFKVEGLSDQDDYASMEQVLERRFRRYIQKDNGFDSLPDLLLIDGGTAHAGIAVSVLEKLGLNIPVFGMVKDDRHRTRALVTADGLQIDIDLDPVVFSLVGNIQEETHRFAIGHHRSLRSKRLRYSELDKIPGIGPKRKQDLLKTFGSIAAIRQADLPRLERILPKDAALAVYTFYHRTQEV